jgi:hypothetical protein
MIDIRKSVFIALILLWAVTTAAPQENFLHHSISATLLVADADQSSDGLSDWADRVGGYFLLKSGEEVVIRFPYSEVGALRNYLEEISELVVDISLHAVDLTEQRGDSGEESHFYRPGRREGYSGHRKRGYVASPGGRATEGKAAKAHGGSSPCPGPCEISLSGADPADRHPLLFPVDQYYRFLLFRELG